MKKEEKSEKPTRRRAAIRYWRISNGCLYARLQYKDETGKWREKLKPITNKRDARGIVEDMRRELTDHGAEMLINDKMTFGQFAPLYKEARLFPAVFANKVKVAGRKSNVQWAYDVLLEYFGSRRLRSIKPRDLELFKAHRLNTITKRGTKRNIGTVNRELSVLRTMLTYAFQNDWILVNPFSKIKGVIASSAETERDRVLGFDEEVRLLKVCVGRRAHLRPILICALDTGMRSGEMLKMKWADIDFLSGVIHVPQENSKTEKSRQIGLTIRVRMELGAIWQRSPAQPHGLVFGGLDSVKRSWNTACTKAKINDFRLHDCRHTATTCMIASGTPHMEVMKITGHTQYKTFLRYLNVTPDSVTTAATRLDAYVVSKQAMETKTEGEVSDAVN
ncbi:MAG: site-specific integrase [Pyrinomonadaceae bacterium]